MKRWKVEILVGACWAFAVWASPSWLGGWLVAIGSPVVFFLVASHFIPEHGPKALAGWLFAIFIVMPLTAALVFGYVPGVYEWFHGNVMPAYESIKEGLIGRTVSTVAWWVFVAFIAPVVWVLAVVWDKLLGIQADPFMYGTPWAVPIMLVVLAASWAFWSTAISRSLHLVGWWDPFWRVDAGRRWVLQAGVRLRDWIEGRVGRSVGWRASLLEVLSLRFLRGDVFLGRPRLWVGGMLRPIGIEAKHHVVTIGPAGAGKNVAALVPNICVHQGSLLCVDPKGHLTPVTARRRGAGGDGVEGLGQAVHVLDPFGIVSGWQTASHNPFDDVRSVVESEDAVRWAQRLAEALIAEDRSEAYWSNAARKLLKGVILYVIIREKEYENWNLVTVRQLLVQGEIERRKGRAEGGEVDAARSDAFDVLLDEMRACRDEPYFGEAIAAAADATGELPPKARQSVFALAAEETSWLDLPELQKSVSGPSDFLLADFKTQKLSVYLCLPGFQMEGRASRWVRMFVMMFIEVMQGKAAPPAEPVLLAIDDFPNLGRIDGIEAVAPVLRSYGVWLWAVAQDIAQLKAIYADSWTEFLGSADAVQFMGVRHPPTLDFIVKSLGAESTDGNRPDAAQLARLLAPAKGNQIVWRGGHRPLLLKMAPYYKYLPRWYYDADPRFQERDHS